MDRIYEAYMGEMGIGFQQKTKARLHWICEQVRGSRVLDIGCSQGIGPLLLGRNGFSVLGLDVNPEAVAYAEGLLEQETDPVKSRVQFRCGDFIDFDAGECRFDNVIFSEVLEHLVRPDLFLEKAWALLGDGGRIIVTVPFGINDDPDHKQTFYYSKLYQMIHRFFSVDTAKVLGKWIGFVGTRRTVLCEEPAAVTFADFDYIEEGFYAVERALLDTNNWYVSQKAKLEQQLSAAKAQLETTVGQLSEAIQENSAQSAALEQEKAKGEQLNADLTAEKAKSEQLNADLTAEKAKGEQLSAELTAEKTISEQLNADLTAEKAKGEQLSAECAVLSENLQHRSDELALLQKKAGHCETDLQRRVKELAQLRQQLDNAQKEAQMAQQQVQEERRQAQTQLQNLQQQMQQVQANLQTKEATVQSLQKTIQDHQQQLSDAGKKLVAVNAQLRKAEYGRSLAEQNYTLLANSKLGRFTRWYWKRKDAVLFQFRKGDPNAKTIRNFSKKIPGLRPFVLWVRRVRGTAVEETPVAVKPQSVPNTAVVTQKPAAPAPAQQDPAPKATTAAPVQPVSTQPANKLTHGDETFFERMKAKIADMPESNGGRYYQRVEKKIGIVCDQFYYDSVYAAADFVYISPDNWEEKVAEIEMLLVVSTWTGLHNEEWRGLSTEGRPKRNLLYQIIDRCRANGIVTVFYSKEDPPHYKDYLGTAKKCDYVFTTAEEVIPDYKRDCGHDRVYSLRFGINPVYHNPVGIRHVPKEDAVIFSGSWMAEQPERCKDLGMIFDGILDSGRKIKVIDRMYKLHADERYQFPDKYFQYASPAIDHDNLQKIHKLYNWAVNINTVKLSQTMFANRVYELQAAGNLLISNYSIGVNSLLPTVFMAHDSDEVGRILNGFTPEEVYERQISGVRKVMTGETCYDRVNEMLDKVGIFCGNLQRKVLVVAQTKNERTAEMFELQSYTDKTLVAASELTDELLAQYDIVAFFADGHEYGVFYLEDMVNGFKYTDSDYITKAGYIKNGELKPGAEHDYVNIMGSKFRTVFWAKSFTAKQLSELGENAPLPNGYSIDHFNYAEGARTAEPEAKYLLSVSLPIYNNGWHLYGKAFASLRRSSMFHQMEILLVDDGSTDGFTPKMVKYLESIYPNVRSYFFNDGGSGSASRPRNKGVELASTEYIMFFDPDDEAVQDAYAKLYRIAVENKHDLVTSNRIKCSDVTSLYDYYYYFKTVYGKDHIVNNQGGYVKKTNFTPVGIQGMIIKKSLIEENQMKQVEGAVGEDTLFSWQLLTVAKNIKATTLASHVYYAARVGSVVNSIGASFFRKHMKCEPACIQWLVANNLLNEYMEKRHNHYVRHWYLKKLAEAKTNEIADCVKILCDILDLYREYYNGKDETINRFLELGEKGDYLGAYWVARDTFYPTVCDAVPDEGFYARIEPQVNAIPTSNGGRYYIPWNYRVGVISDDFLYNSYKDVADCVPLSPENWEQEIDSLDLFLLITGWKGIDQEWKNCSVEGSPSRELIYKIIDTCNEKGIPTVFYSIEDPPNYDVFINVAKHCHYVFTTAEERVPDYQRDCGHDRVQVLRFGMNPLFHNPVGMRSFPKINEVIFSGSWMAKYPDRCRDMEMIFDGVLHSGTGLRVINRNFYIGNPNYKFPDRFLGYTSPAIAHENLQRVHKLYNWAINTNSVRESYTMFANRVYELQAAGNILLSNNSPGVNKWLPTIHLIQDGNEIPRVLNAYTPEQLYERQITGVRFSMTGESSFDRFAQILKVLDLDFDVTTRAVAVVADRITPEVTAMFERQSLSGCGLFEEGSVTESDLLPYDIVAFWNHSAHYGEFYLEDMVNAFKYTDCDYITKDAHMQAGELVAGKEHDYVAYMGDKYRSVFWKSSYSLRNLLALTAGELANGYAIDHFNYDAEPVAQETVQRDYKLSVVIPVYNNGKHLYGKALASLMRSSVFEELEIIFMDGGSDDGYTDKLQSWLCSRYPNLRMETIPYSGEDFLQQARAAGAQMATAPYVAFLNPENEVLTDAYARLLEWAQEENADAVMGNLRHFELRAEHCACTEQAVCLTESAAVADTLCQAGADGEMQNFVVRKELLVDVDDYAAAQSCLGKVERLSLHPIDMLIVYH